MRGKISLFTVILPASVLLLAAGFPLSGVESAIALVPLPSSMELSAGQFTMTAGTKIVTGGESKEIEAIGQYLSDRLGSAMGFKLSVLADERQGAAANSVVLTTSGANLELGDEGYELTANDAGVVIRAPKPAGLFYGVQTLRQLLPPQIEQSTKAEGVAWTVPGVKIKDKPRFVWRGYLLDVGRHFRSTEFVKRYIDCLAYNKMNLFHWHLTEDQGWRIEIKKYPKLTEVGSWRGTGDKRYGGFYTQDEVRDIVAYAASRYVTVMPEIEMPGHSVGALSAYPQFSCTGGPFQVGTKWGVYEDVYCAGNDQTFEFIEDVLNEVLALFPSKFIHIGGDECPKTRWHNCPKCQQRMKDNNLKDEHALQSYFIQHIDKFLASKGRRLIGWDEILEGGLAPGAAVMSWRGIKGGISAAKMNHDVVMSPTSHCYLDLGASLQTVYSYEPIPKELSPDQAKHVLGAQGNMWGENTPKDSDVDRQTWPRLAALAEVTWSPAGRDFGEFSTRLATHIRRLRLMGIAIALPPGQPIGRWEPAQMSETFKRIDWDASNNIPRAGKYDLTFKYEHGAHRIDIAWVALLENGTEITRDTHAGQSGSLDHDNVYHFTLPERKAGATYALRVQCRSDGGTDSSGAVWIKTSEQF